MPTTPRILTAAAGLLITALALSACANGSTGDDAASSAAVPAGEGGTSYPLELPTDYGTTALDEQPQRVAVIGGLHDLEAVLALGVAPVLANDPTAWPWLREHGGDEIAETFDVWSPDGLPFEQILASDPDVIIAGTYGELASDYDRLAEIAPVVAMESYAGAEPWQVGWKDLTRTIGAALDLTGVAESLIEASDALVAETAAAHPAWAGTTTSFVVNYGEAGGLTLANYAGSAPEELFTGLGFAPQPAAQQLAELDGTLSAENLQLLDAESIVVAQHGGEGTSEEAASWLEGTELFTTLPAVQAGRYGVMQPDADGLLPIAWAFSYPNALAIEYIVEQLSDVYGDIIPS